MPVYKRSPGLDADSYYVSGATVRRRAPSAQREPVTRRVPDNRSELFPQKSAQERATQRRAPLERRRELREPLYDTRSTQERRRAEPTRAYYAAEPSTQRLTRAQVNHRTVQQHAYLRAEQERLHREQEARRQAEEEAEERRRRRHRVQTAVAFAGIAAAVAVAFTLFVLLVRYAKIEQMVVQQRQITAQIEDQQKRLEELQVEINMQGNITQIQEYARQNLGMDYASQENTRTIVLPDE